MELVFQDYKLNITRNTNYSATNSRFTGVLERLFELTVFQIFKSRYYTNYHITTIHGDTYIGF